MFPIMNESLLSYWYVEFCFYQITIEILGWDSREALETLAVLLTPTKWVRSYNQSILGSSVGYLCTSSEAARPVATATQISQWRHLNQQWTPTDNVAFISYYDHKNNDKYLFSLFCCPLLCRFFRGLILLYSVWWFRTKYEVSRLILCYNVLSDRRNLHSFDHHHHGQLTCRKIMKLIPFRREYQRVFLGGDHTQA